MRFQLIPPFNPVQRDETNQMAIMRPSGECMEASEGCPDANWKAHPKIGDLLVTYYIT